MASKAKILKSIQHFDNVGKEIERFEERIRDAIAEPDCSAALIDVLKSKIEKYEKKLEETFSELNIDVGDKKCEKYLDMQDSLLNYSVSLEKATVIDNSDLTEIDKLQYLFASAKGNAAKLIRGFAIKKENLKNCWELLCERYENKNQLANCQINKLFSIRTNKVNSAKQLLEILDNSNESVRNLTVLGLEINQLSELIKIIKPHEEIAHRWVLTLKPDTYPTLQAFRMFIESEARALGLLSGNADAPKSKLGTSNQIINKSYAESRKNVGALKDNASQLSLISGRLKEKLNIPVKSEKHKISGINGVNAETSLHSCTIEFTPRFSSLKFNLEAIVVHKVISPLPNFQFENRQFPHLKNLKLADPNFHISKPIDVLLGAEIYADLLEGMPIFGPAGTPTAIPTKLGYILSGKIYAPPLKESIVNSSLNDQLSELWKLEEVPKTNAKIQIPDSCEESFSKSVKRNNERRYIVNRPFKENNTLGERKEKAVQLLYALENKFHKNKQFKDNFLNFMNEYLALGHMREISQKRDDETPNCYIPYHMLINENLPQPNAVLFLMLRLKQKMVKGQLKSEEVESAHKFLVKTIQQAEYSQEISHLKYHKPIPRSSKLISLNIFLDEDEILRVGGRLTKQPTLSFDQKFPIIIPKHHPITTLVIRQFHLRGFHSGTQMTLSLIRQHYWITDGRSTVRREIKRCIECCRFNSKPSYPKMGDLPKQRITQTRPFEIVGIDFAGPILTKCQHLRKANKFKSYICLFICLATKAVHLELVSTLSTDAILAALRRFIARCGHPSEIHSDNDTNFIGANNYLKQLYMLVKEHSIQKYSTDRNIRWKFIPTYAPNFGGLWESSIKLAKRHLIKTCKGLLLSFEELSTMLCQIEACINSRTLVPLSSDPAYIRALTPGHFLIGEPLLEIPESKSITNTSLSLSCRWKSLLKLRQHFWDRWHKEVLHHYQSRPKWKASQSEVQVGNLVLISDDNRPPLSWPMARILKLIPSTDGTNREAILQTGSGLTRRSINKIVVLPICAREDEDSEIHH
ncbi:integrase catalytic domain-containing protein [Trichonephila clavipes]|nr:integrase catalytic domain-containing protein [Trichonephila clavipes]